MLKQGIATSVSFTIQSALRLNYCLRLNCPVLAIAVWTPTWAKFPYMMINYSYGHCWLGSSTFAPLLSTPVLLKALVKEISHLQAPPSRIDSIIYFKNQSIGFTPLQSIPSPWLCHLLNTRIEHNSYTHQSISHAGHHFFECASCHSRSTDLPDQQKWNRFWKVWERYEYRLVQWLGTLCCKKIGPWLQVSSNEIRTLEHFHQLQPEMLNTNITD